MADAQTYTSDAGALQDRIDSITRAVQQGYKDVPNVQKSLADAVSQNEGAVAPLVSDRSGLVQQLFDSDRNLASKYATPGNESYIENPMARESAYAGREGALYGGIDKLNGLIQLRQALLGNAIQRGIELHKAGVAAQEAELNNLLRQQQRMDALSQQKEDTRRWESEFALKQKEAAKSGAGNKVDYAQVPVKTADGRVEMHWAKINTRTGEVIEDIGKIEQPSVAESLAKLRSASKNVDTNKPPASFNPLRLKDPKTGQIYQYDGGTADPDYINDLRSGFTPA